jgi:hypothetical protein
MAQINTCAGPLLVNVSMPPETKLFRHPTPPLFPGRCIARANWVERFPRFEPPDSAGTAKAAPVVKPGR